MSIYIHDTAILDEEVNIGDNCHIWHWTHVSKGARIGCDSSLGQNVYIGEDVVVGSRCKIQNNVSIYNAVELEDDVFCGPSMVFTNVINPRANISRKHEYKKTLVKRGATVGANATIICGVTLGEYSFIAAGAVVTKDVEPYALMMGVPARCVGYVDKEGNRVDA